MWINYLLITTLVMSQEPRQWKRANVVPIHKGRNKMETLNYGSVSLTSIVSKLCEIVIKDRWVEYLEDEKIITEKQFGFRKGRSSVTNLLSFYMRVIDGVQERDGWVDVVYLNLKKASDKAPHKRRMQKPENGGGLKGATLKWMEDYLQGREVRDGLIRYTRISKKHLIKFPLKVLCGSQRMEKD